VYSVQAPKKRKWAHRISIAFSPRHVIDVGENPRTGYALERTRFRKTEATWVVIGGERKWGADHITDVQSFVSTMIMPLVPTSWVFLFVIGRLKLKWPGDHGPWRRVGCRVRIPHGMQTRSVKEATSWRAGRVSVINEQKFLTWLPFNVRNRPRLGKEEGRWAG